jgi:hypothetical protein
VSGRTPSSSDLSGTEVRAQLQLSKPARLRTIYRLRSGLPPTEHLADLTIGADTLMACTKRLLEASPRSARWLQVVGDYGEGKSHSLTLLRELARQQNYATCYLTCDGSSSALNHPQRFLSVLLATLAVPGQSVHGYEDFLCEILRDRTSTEALHDVVNRRVSGAHFAAADLRWHLARLVRAYRLNEGAGEEALTAHTRSIVLHLSGQSIRHRPGAPQMRRFAYELLQVVVDYAVVLGRKGVFVLVDEVESIYTKLPNARSRHGAHRVLSALCEAPVFGHCRVVLAVTPDAHRWLRADTPSMHRSASDLDCEPVREWANRLTADTLTTVVCHRLDQPSRVHLLTQIREFYLRTYPQVRERLREDRWIRFVKDLVPRALPVRLLMRQTIDFLDGQRYALK